MAQVSVTINSRQYRMACDDGQEDQLLRLATDLDSSIATVRENFGEIGDMRLTVMAALLLAEELAEARARLERVDTEIADLKHAHAVADGRAEAARAAMATTINGAAARIEEAVKLLTRRVEQESTALG